MEIAQARKTYMSWLRIGRDLSPHTLRAYESDVRSLEAHCGERVAANEITTALLTEYLNDQRRAGLSSRSLRRRTSGIRGFSRWLVEQGVLDSDPWIGVATRLPGSRTLPRALSTHDLDRLLAHLCDVAKVDQVPAEATLARPHAATTLLAVAIMVATGVRVSELVDIRCGAIDLPGRSVRILGKGRRERVVYVTNDWLARFICSYQHTRELLDVEHDRLLFNRHGGPMSATTIRVRIEKAARDAQILRTVTPHMLRHTAATQLIESGVDIRFVQRLLGHASLSTTELYTHVSDRALRRTVSDADVLGSSLRRDN